MGFWFFMLIMTILLPVIMRVFGKVLLKSAPKEINPVFGYRTTMSMKNKDTWDFANKYIGNLWYKCGIVLLIITIMLMLCSIGGSSDTVGRLGGIVVMLQMVPLIGTIIPTERALMKKFDKNGNRKYFLRPVSESDAKILYDWINDPVTRQNSFQTQPVVWEEHINWLQQKLKDINSFLFIMSDGQNDCGTIRIDIKKADKMISEAYGLISFSIAPTCRGKGLGEKILALAEQLVKEIKGVEDKEQVKDLKNDIMDTNIKLLVGEVKVENIASCKCFEKNHYILEKEVNGEVIFCKRL